MQPSHSLTVSPSNCNAKPSGCLPREGSELVPEANPARRERTDIDVLAADEKSGLLIGECKYREAFDETEAVEGLVAKRSLVRDREASWFYLFSKRPASEATRRKYAQRGDVRLLTLEELWA